MLRTVNFSRGHLSKELLLHKTISLKSTVRQKISWQWAFEKDPPVKKILIFYLKEPLTKKNQSLDPKYCQNLRLNINVFFTGGSLYVEKKYAQCYWVFSGMHTDMHCMSMLLAEPGAWCACCSAACSACSCACLQCCLHCLHSYLHCKVFTSGGRTSG